jgi:hypothetical protein
MRRILVCSDTRPHPPATTHERRPRNDFDWFSRVVSLIAIGIAMISCEREGPPPLLHYDVPVTSQPGSTGPRTTSLLAVFRPDQAQFHLANTQGHSLGVPPISFGNHDDLPLLGDWNGDGTPSIGTYSVSDHTFRLRNSNDAGPPDYVVPFGGPGDYPIVGDWDGDGTITIGVFNRNTALFSLRNENSAGKADITFTFGLPGDVPVAGDWDGDGDTTVGVYRPQISTFYLRKDNAAGNPDIGATFGAAGDLPITGDWTGRGQDTIGLYRPSLGMFLLRRSNNTGIADVGFAFGIANDKPSASLHPRVTSRPSADASARRAEANRSQTPP